MKWHRQYLIAITLAVLNVDWVLMPIIRLTGIAGLWFFIIIGILGTIELYIWFWFWKWFRVNPLKELALKAKGDRRVQEAIFIGEDIQSDLKKAEVWDDIKYKVKNYLYNTFQKTTD